MLERAKQFFKKFFTKKPKTPTATPDGNATSNLEQPMSERSASAGDTRRGRMPTGSMPAGSVPARSMNAAESLKKPTAATSISSTPTSITFVFTPDVLADDVKIADDVKEKPSETIASASAASVSTSTKEEDLQEKPSENMPVESMVESSISAVSASVATDPIVLSVTTEENVQQKSTENRIPEEFALVPSISAVSASAPIISSVLTATKEEDLPGKPSENISEESTFSSSVSVVSASVPTVSPVVISTQAEDTQDEPDEKQNVETETLHEVVQNTDAPLIVVPAALAPIVSSVTVDPTPTIITLASITDLKKYGAEADSMDAQLTEQHDVETSVSKPSINSAAQVKIETVVRQTSAIDAMNVQMTEQQEVKTALETDRQRDAELKTRVKYLLSSEQGRAEEITQKTQKLLWANKWLKPVEKEKRFAMVATFVDELENFQTWGFIPWLPKAKTDMINGLLKADKETIMLVMRVIEVIEYCRGKTWPITEKTVTLNCLLTAVVEESPQAMVERLTMQVAFEKAIERATWMMEHRGLEIKGKPLHLFSLRRAVVEWLLAKEKSIAAETPEAKIQRLTHEAKRELAGQEPEIPPLAGFRQRDVKVSAVGDTMGPQAMLTQFLHTVVRAADARAAAENTSARRAYNRLIQLRS